jgi:hypothetical protein
MIGIGRQLLLVCAGRVVNKLSGEESDVRTFEWFPMLLEAAG